MAGGPYRIDVAARALKDLDEIATYIGVESPEAAAKMLDRLWAAIQTLVNLPQRYVVVSDGAKSAKAVRRLPVLPYLVYYRVLKKRNTVRVLTIRHGAGRQARRFPV